MKTSHNSFFLSRRNWTRELRQARCRKILDRKGEEETFARKVASIHCEFFSRKQTPDYNLSQKNFPALQDNTSLTLSVPEFCSRRHKLVLAQTRKLIVEETEGIWRKKWFFLRSERAGGQEEHEYCRRFFDALLLLLLLLLPPPIPPV
jgi:hypothetical protein